MIKVGIIGANGRMGRQVEQALSTCADFDIVARIGRADNLDQIINTTNPDVVFELSGHENVLAHSRYLIENGFRVVIGSSGLTIPQINDLAQMASAKNVGVLLVPNFSMAVANFCVTLGTMRSLIETAMDCTIIEYHHTQKKDKPSGTARYIASLIGVDEGKITSVRDDQYHARHDVILTLGGGETITLSVETADRQSYAQGIIASARKVMGLNHFVQGLEKVI